MTAAPERRGRWAWLAAVLGLGFLAAAGLVLFRLAAPSSGPVDVPWDRVGCAHCRMLVSDARFAGQLHTRAGEVLFFDDPGCLLLHRAGRDDPGTAFFHDSRAERWLSEEQVGFVPAAETPMDYGFAAVERAAVPTALSAAQALAAIRAAPAEHPAP